MSNVAISRPFRRGPFGELPELPRLPHPYDQVLARDVEVRSAHFGRLNIHIRELGEGGEPLLLVHGLMTTSYSWRYVYAPLAEHFRVIAMDLPGAGRSDMPDVDYGPEPLADFLVELMEALGVVGAPVVGNSMGGYIAMWAALRHPSAMRALVNVHSPGLPEARLWALKMALAIPGTRFIFDRLVGLSPHRWVHRNVHYRDESLKSLEEARAYGDPLKTRAGRDALRRYLADTMDPSDMRRFVARLDEAPFPVPLCLLYAREDPMVPARIGPALHRHVPAAHFEWLENASHFAHIDQPALTVERIVAYLGGD